MNDTEKPKFAQSMAALGEIYGKEITEVLVGIYWNALKTFEWPEVQRSFQAHTRDTDNGQFMPKPADLIRHIEGNKDGRALAAWSKVAKAIGSIGGGGSVVFDDPIIHGVINDMGGWIDLCKVTEEELVFKGKEFEKRYRAALLTGVAEVLPVLIGADDAYNIRNGFQERPKVKFIGDKQRCMLIRQGSANQLIGSSSAVQTLVRIAQC